MRDVAELAQRRPRSQRFTGGRTVIVRRRTKLAESGSSNIAHVTLLGQVCNDLASQVALTSRTYQMIFAADLERQSVHWTPGGYVAILWSE